MRNLIRKLDENISAMVQISVVHLFQLGLKYGIFSRLSEKQPYNALINSMSFGNKSLLKKLLDTYIQLGIIKKENGNIVMDEFEYLLKLSPRNAQHLLPGWVPIFEEIYKMVDYASITPEHPKILMDFDKDADFWDMRLSLEFNSIYRKIIADVAKLHDDTSVLDLGCGSVSPLEIGQFLGPNGKYVGIDFSPGILSIAESRVKSAGFDWVTLKEMDIKKIIPKNKYDVVIMSFVLEYLDSINRVIKTAMSILNENGKLIIVEPFKENYPNISAWEFFESLSKEFIAFPTKSAILNALENSNTEFKFNELGKSVLVITKM